MKKNEEKKKAQKVDFGSIDLPKLDLTGFNTPGNGIVMKAEGDGGSNSGGDSGGWDFSNDDLPF